MNDASLGLGEMYTHSEYKAARGEGKDAQAQCELLCYLVTGGGTKVTGLQGNYGCELLFRKTASSGFYLWIGDNSTCLWSGVTTLKGLVP